MERNDILQLKEIDYIKNKWNAESMIEVYRDNYTEMNCSIYIIGYLIPKDKIADELQNYGKNHVSIEPGFINIGGEYIYKRFNTTELVEPFVLLRNYNNLADRCIEIIEEFRLLFDLYYDANKNRYMDLKKNKCVVYLEGDSVKVDSWYLKTFLGIKNMAMVLFEVISLYFNDDSTFKKIISENKDRLSEIGSNYNFKLIVSDAKDSCTGYNYLSHLQGKSIVNPRPLNGCGIWPYNKEPEYIEFKIGRDENGNDITYTCNPEVLNGPENFKSNVPNYTTNVVFDKGVLYKYRNDCRYKVDESFVKFGSLWSLPIDNMRDDNYIIAYLGDLGMYLPNKEEQCHWFSYNVVADVKLSKVKYDQDFRCIYGEPTDILSSFKKKYNDIKRISVERLGWPLYKELNEADKYLLDNVHVPNEYSQNDFDDAVLSLAKLIGDSLNTKEIKRLISEEDPNYDFEDFKTINGLKDLFGMKKLDESYVSKLQNIQGVRSESSAHKKSKDYEKNLAKRGINNMSFDMAFKHLLKEAYEFLCYTENNIDMLK